MKVAGSANNSLLVYFVQWGFNEGMSNIGPQPNNSALLHNTGRWAGCLRKIDLKTWRNLFAKGLSPSKAYDLLNLIN